jgi:hypothetical protein
VNLLPLVSYLQIMNKSISARLFGSLIFCIVLFTTNAQLNSLDVYGGMNLFTKSYYTKNPSPAGYSYGLRYNQHLSWELNGTAAFAMSKSAFYLATERDGDKTTVELASNSYMDLQVALQWQWLTEVRTRSAGGGRRQSCKGAKAIIFANFKSYLIGGLEMRMLSKSSYTYSRSAVTNFFAGIGFDTYRFGKNAHHGSNAFVPFVEAYYLMNFGTPYAVDVTKTGMFMDGLNFRAGMKYTFGFKEKKFSW